MDHRVRKIGVFYDGSYVFQVRNYYKRVHDRHGILDFNGLHTFVKQEIARIEGLSEQELSMCKLWMRISFKVADRLTIPMPRR